MTALSVVLLAPRVHASNSNPGPQEHASRFCGNHSFKIIADVTQTFYLEIESTSHLAARAYSPLPRDTGERYASRTWAPRQTLPGCVRSTM